MLSHEIRQDMLRTELLISTEETGEAPGYYEKMLDYNEIHNVLRFSVKQIDNYKRYVYDITGKTSLDGMLAHQKLPFSLLHRFLWTFIQTVNNCREYLIDEGDFLLYPEYVFYSAETERFFFCCYPGHRCELREQFSRLMEYLMNRIDYNDKPAVVTVYELYMKCKENSCTFDMIIKILEKNNAGESQKQTTESEPSVPVRLADPEPVRREDSLSGNETDLRTEEIGGSSKKKNSRLRLLPGFLRNYLVSEEEDGQDSSICPKKNEKAEVKTELLYGLRYEYSLVAKDNEDEQIYLTKFPFYIGKSGANLNCEISSPVISRMHAKFSKREDEVYFEDMMSTNGSFLNGIRLRKNEICRVQNGDEIMLADRRYRFVCRT